MTAHWRWFCLLVLLYVVCTTASKEEERSPKVMPFVVVKDGGIFAQERQEKEKELYTNAERDWGEFQKFARTHEDERSLEAGRASCARLGLDAPYQHLRAVDKSRKNPAGSKRLLYLTTLQALFFMTDRWNFHMYLGLAARPRQYTTILWGVGMPGFNVNETLGDNIERWFQDPDMDVVVTTWNFHRTYVGVETWRDWKFSTMYADLSKGPHRHRHRLKEKLDDVSQLQKQRRALEFHRYTAASKTVEPLLPGAPIVVVFVNEIEPKDERDISEIRPHIIFAQVEQQLGALRQVDVCGNERNESGSCDMHPVLKSYLAASPAHALFAHMPQGIHAPFFNRALGPRDLVDSCDRSAKRGEILLLGALNHRIYPLRSAALTVKKAYTKVLTHYPHPGYREENEWHGSLESMCHAFFRETVPQQHSYVRNMKTSRLCLLGSRSFNLGHEQTCSAISWTLRKYVEAMAAGCVVIGDVPSDYSLARHVPVRLTNQKPTELSWSVEAALDRYNREDLFLDYCREGRRTVLENYTFAAILGSYFAPALTAYAAKQRGVFRLTQSTFMVRGNDDCRASDGTVVPAGNRSVSRG